MSHMSLRGDNRVNDCDNYAYLNQNLDPSGFTNRFLESRHSDQLFGQKYADYKLYDEPADRPNMAYRTILGNMWVRSKLSDLYFGDKNLKHLMRLVCDTVKEQSGFVIDPASQSETELLTIMRYMFIEHSKHLDHSYREQIAELNLKVLMDVVPRIIERVNQELSYRRDHSSQPMTMANPINVSSAGTRSNKSVSAFFV